MNDQFANGRADGRKLLIIANATNTHTHRFIDEFRFRGWDVSVLSIQPPNRRNIERFGDVILPVPTHRIYYWLVRLPWYRYSEFHNINSGVKAYEPYSISSALTYLYLLFAVRSVAKKAKATSVFTIYLTMNGVLAALSGIRPIVASAAGIDVSSHKPWTMKYLLNHPSLLRFAVKSARRVIAFDRDTFEPIFQKKRCKIDNLMWIGHWGVQTDMFRPANKLGRSTDECVFLVSRPYRPEFDLESIIRGIVRLHDRHPGITMIIATGAQSQQNLTGLHKILASVPACQSFVSILPHVEYKQLPILLQKGDVYVDPVNVEKVPTTADWGVSGSLLEAMSTGLIPVVARRPGVDWILPSSLSRFRHEAFGTDFDEALNNAFQARNDCQLRNEIRNLVVSKANWQRNIDKIEAELSTQ